MNEQIIEHDNVFYLTDISQIGGVETFVYENCKKYQDRDICVVYKTAHFKQLERLKKFCKCYQLTPNTKINCKVAMGPCPSPSSPLGCWI